jgi:hypothetical protein
LSDEILFKAWSEEILGGRYISYGDRGGLGVFSMFPLGFDALKSLSNTSEGFLDTLGISRMLQESEGISTFLLGTSGVSFNRIVGTSFPLVFGILAVREPVNFSQTSRAPVINCE